MDASRYGNYFTGGLFQEPGRSRRLGRGPDFCRVNVSVPIRQALGRLQKAASIPARVQRVGQAGHGVAQRLVPPPPAGLVLRCSFGANLTVRAALQVGESPVLQDLHSSGTNGP